MSTSKQKIMGGWPQECRQADELGTTEGKWLLLSHYTKIIEDGQGNEVGVEMTKEWEWLKNGWDADIYPAKLQPSFWDRLKYAFTNRLPKQQ